MAASKPPISQRARRAYADAIRAQGPAYANTAHNVAAGFSNYWIEPALRAIDTALSRVPEDDGDDDG